MGKKSREKGKRGERQARDWWRDNLQIAGVHRNQQYKGGGDSADLGGIPLFHTEVKVGRRTPDIYAAVHQCESDCPPEKLPIVQLRKDREQWLFVLPESTFREVADVYLWGVYHEPVTRKTDS